MEHDTLNPAAAMPVRTRLAGTPAPQQAWRGAAGLRLAGDAWGDPAAPLVLLLHGGGQTRHAWRGTGERLAAAGYRTVAFDARGHGDSDWAADGDYGHDAMVQDLACVIAAQPRPDDAPPPLLVGASMGGMTSLVALGEQQVAASALVLVDVVPYTEPAGVGRIHRFMREHQGAGFASLEEVAQAIGGYRGRREGAPDLSGLGKNVRLGADGRYHWHYDPRFIGPPRDLAARYARLAACARALTQPTLLVRGGMSDVVSEAGVRDFLGLCPHAEYVNVAAAGHMVTGDRNDAFGRAATEFLARTVPPQRP
ncbi:alpha/beta fold hydrolase [Pseudorhodoferax sp.]|uniref:alpha/beta fold hydrolase n=1 Tax=Pseudorhodoferax sp. TaxID=1993553 RepID=UPI002DD6A548|nr:alpha/beta fold hydrolase [Pseudorhodoferax sp.]